MAPQPQGSLRAVGLRGPGITESSEAEPTRRGIRLWRLDLAPPVSQAEQAILSPAERERAGRFIHEADRRRSAAAHAALRQLLAAECRCPPDRLQFSVGWAGKPHLRVPASGSFNLSHSGDVALLLWDPEGHEWGIDLEVQRPIEDRDAVAQRVFTPAECEALERAAQAGLDRDRTFLQVWARKEACLKALGTGFSLEPSTFAAGLGPAQARVRVELPALLQARMGATAVLKVFDLDAGADVAAAAAVRTDRVPGPTPVVPPVHSGP